MKYISYTQANPPSLLRKTAAIVTTAIMAGVALLFSTALIAVLLAAGAVAAAYLWWKTRELRKHLRNMPPYSGAMEKGAGLGADPEGVDGRGMAGGEVIEGQAVRVDEAGQKIRR